MLYTENHSEGKIIKNKTFRIDAFECLDKCVDVQTYFSNLVRARHSRGTVIIHSMLLCNENDDVLKVFC